jgi:hypothetical protein
VPREVGRTLNPAWEQWRAQREHVTDHIERVKGAKNPHGEKWLTNTLAYYQRQLAEHDEKQPPKYLEDVEHAKATASRIQGTLTKPKGKKK